MKLSNIESRKLLPRFASKIAWLMDALDSIIKPISERVKSIDAPLTLESIAALTDEELEALYEQYGVAKYYPELSRSTRDLMLYEMCKIYRYLGTPHAIELLCNYIFDNMPLNVHVLDNLAFDEHGSLVDATLLDIFDIEVNPDLPVLSVDATARLLANIIRFSRNSQSLRDIIYTFSEDFSLPIYPLRAGIPAQNWDNDAICTLPPMTFIVVDSATGAIVHGFNQELTTYELPSVVLNSEDGYKTYELPSVSLPTPNVVIGVPITGPVQAFWFTDEGRAETSDKTFTVVGNPLFDEDGSVARNELYDSAVPLSFMQQDGNMFEADSDSDVVRYLPVTDRLVLSIPGDSTTRDKSAWSVQVAKLFVLSYANEQLPDVQIELPINEVGAYGTSITLPTIDGEYESGGKTWKPSAWDIGAFGSSYTLNADTVAHLIFEEVQQYQEITLYIQSGNKNIQTRVTSRFTGDVNSSFVYQLYKDENLTIPWSGYDYSNDYQVGYIGTLDGEWHRRIDNIGDMPDTTVSEGVTLAFVLLDNSKIWLCCNSSSGLTSSPVSGVIVLRIYPKGQQYHAAYAYGSSTYGNAYIGISSSKVCTNGPGSLQYIQTPHQFPHITLQKVLGAAGNEITVTNFVTGQGEDDTRFHVINSGTREANIRTVIFTLEYPVIGYWLRPEGTNISTLSGVAYPLMNIGGEIIEIDNNFDYFPVALIQHNGNYATQTYSYLNNATMGAFDPEHPTWLCFKQVSGTLSLSYVQYYKKPKS